LGRKRSGSKGKRRGQIRKRGVEDDLSTNWDGSVIQGELEEDFK